jgi:hypothetical protein
MLMEISMKSDGRRQLMASWVTAICTVILTVFAGITLVVLLIEKITKK